MLPDFPDLKGELAELLDRFLRRRVTSHMGFMGTVGKRRAFEGAAMAVRRPSGEEDRNEYSTISVTRELLLKDVPHLTLYETLRRLEDASMELGAKASTSAFGSLDKTLRDAGQMLDSGGEPMSAELLLKMIERMELSFDDTGRAKLALVTHPSNIEAGKAIVRALDEDPEVRARFDTLINKKQESWREREASRKLVG